MDTFNWKPFYVANLTTSHHVLISKFENGMEQRRYKRREPRVWELSFQVRYAQLQEMKAFYEARKGPFEAFLYHDGWSDQRVVVRFKEEPIQWETGFRRNGIVSFKFVEVL